MAKIIYLCQLCKMCKGESPCLYQKWSERSYLVYLCQLGIFAVVGGCTKLANFSIYRVAKLPFLVWFYYPLGAMISPICVVLLFGSGRGGVGWDEQSPELFPEFPAYAEHFIVFSNTPSPFTQTGIWHTRLEKESKVGEKKAKKKSTTQEKTQQTRSYRAKYPSTLLIIKKPQVRKIKKWL